MAIGCDMLTIGQYLQPTKAHIEIAEFIHPDQFEVYRRIGMEKGLQVCGPAAQLVRSSYNAIEGMRELGGKCHDVFEVRQYGREF